jgi:hypothetical protein
MVPIKSNAAIPCNFGFLNTVNSVLDLFDLVDVFDLFALFDLSVLFDAVDDAVDVVVSRSSCDDIVYIYNIVLIMHVFILNYIHPKSSSC